MKKSNLNKKMIKKKKRKLKIIIKRTLIVSIILGTSYIFISKVIKFSNASINTLNEKNNEVIDNKSNADNNKSNEVIDVISNLDSNNEYLKLINRTNSVDSDYEPDDLVTPNIRLQTASDTTALVRREVANALEDMFNDAKKVGINLIGISGYRPYDYQKVIYNNKISRDGVKEANKYVAKPGTSEHQSGLVMDILSTEYTNLDEGFENTNAYKWLSKNMSKYGFILRYPKGKESITGYQYEPWHLRYVGVDAAKDISEKQLTLEEYLEN